MKKVLCGTWVTGKGAYGAETRQGDKKQTFVTELFRTARAAKAREDWAEVTLYERDVASDEIVPKSQKTYLCMERRTMFRYEKYKE